jgi:hypothetical protein
MKNLSPCFEASMPGRESSPARDELLNGAVNYTVDYRAVYFAVLQGWLNPARGRFPDGISSRSKLA